MTQQHPTTQYHTLFSPLQVGKRQLRNRIINSGHGTALGPGTHNEDLFAYEARRAQGGAAVVITHANAVSPGIGAFYALDEAKKGHYDQLAQRVHAHGALAFVQLNHPGRQAPLGPNRSQVILFSASSVPQREYGSQIRVPRALNEEEIGQVITDFADAAAAVAATAIDGIELHFGHGNLVQQFLSPETNQREDRWGGNSENRIRLALEILRAIRQRIGDRLVVGARINLELAPQAEPHSELTEQVSQIIDSGLLDYVSVSGGNFSSGWGVATNLPDASFPAALWKEAAKKLKSRQSRVPVWLAGRVLNPQLADELITTGYCDAVTMARELVADPDLPEKTVRGEANRVRPCVGIQSGCWQRVADGNPIHCAFNPVAGYEAVEKSKQATHSDNALNVVVVGGGPAGLEAARNAALQGHHVTLYDQRDRLGGQLALIEQVPHRQNLREIIGWFEQELAISRVRVALNQRVTLAQLRDLRPDQVILACGGQESEALSWRDGFDGQIYTVNQILERPLPALQSVVIYDEWGGRAALSVAEYLAAQGHRIEFITSLTWAGEGLNGTVRLPAVTRLARQGVIFHTEQALVLHQHRLQRQNLLNDQLSLLPGNPDSLVTSLIPQVNNALYHEVIAAGFAVQIVGDARAPRGLTEATREGFLAAQNLGCYSPSYAL